MLKCPIYFKTGVINDDFNKKKENLINEFIYI